MDNIQLSVIDNKFIASKDEKGIWIYKANESVLFKKDSNVLKAKYHDLPRFPIILEYEDNFKKEVSSFILDLAKDLVKKMISIKK